MSDLTKKITDKIADKIIEEIGKKRREAKTDKVIGEKPRGKKREKEIAQEKREEIKIENPEVSFIFTIALNGKIDISDEITKSIRKQNICINRKNNKDYTIIAKNEFFSEKDPIFSDILNVSNEGEITEKKDPPFIHVLFDDFDKSYLQYFISKTFISKAVLAYWKYKPSNDKILNNILNETKERYEEEGGDLSDLPKDILKLTKLFTAELKLFSIGSISILIRNDKSILSENSKSIYLSPEEIKKSIEYPELSVERDTFVVNGKKIKIGCGTSKKEVSGFLNMFAYGLASHVFNEFFRWLSNSQDKTRSNFLKVSRVCKESKKHEHLITDRFRRGLYTNKIIKAPISSPPNCKKLSNRVNFLDEKQGKSYIIYRGDPNKRDELLLYKQFVDRKEDLVSLVKMFSIIKERPKNGEIELPKELLEFYESEENPRNSLQKFLLKKELKKFAGKLWNAPLHATPYIGVKFNSIPQTYIEEEFLKHDTPYNTLIFCLESIFATTKSVNSFNEELEGDVFPKIDNILNKRFNDFRTAFYRDRPITYVGIIAAIVLLLFAAGMSVIANCSMAIFFVCHLAGILRNYFAVNKLNEIINKVRVLSPSEDILFDIAISLKSEIGLKEASISDEFGLRTLIRSGYKHLENYEIFIKNCYGSLITQANWILVFLVLYIGMVNLLFSNIASFSWRALIKKFGINASAHESLIQSLINLIYQ